MKITELLKKIEVEEQKTTRDLEKLERIRKLHAVAAQYEGDDKVISSEDIYNQILNDPEGEKYTCGITSLDTILGGFRPEQLITISGITKHGKTAFCVHLTACLQHLHPVWFPFEESARELIQKFVDRKEKPPIFFTPQTMRGNTTEWIEQRIIEAIAKYDSKIVFVDQLDFIVPMNGDNHALRVGQAVRDLKGLAKKWNICIFLICHLVKTKMDNNPTLEDLKGSSSIAQESDTVILIWRETNKENGEVVITENANISVQANRRTGKTGNVKMVYDEGKYVERDWSRGMGEEGNSLIKEVQRYEKNKGTRV